MRHVSNLFSSIFFLAAAWGIWSSIDLRWGGGMARDGTRFSVSPRGVSHVRHTDRTAPPEEECLFVAKGGTPTCRQVAGAGRAFRLLTMVEVLARFGAVAAVLAGIFCFARGTMPRLIFSVTTIVMVLAALALMAYAAPRAILDLAVIPFGIGGTKATMTLSTICAAIAGLIVSVLADAVTGSPLGRGARLTIGIASVAGAITAFVFMFPWPSIAVFAAPAIALGLSLGRWTVACYVTTPLLRLPRPFPA